MRSFFRIAFSSYTRAEFFSLCDHLFWAKANKSSCKSAFYCFILNIFFILFMPYRLTDKKILFYTKPQRLIKGGD